MVGLYHIKGISGKLIETQYPGCHYNPQHQFLWQCPSLPCLSVSDEWFSKTVFPISAQIFSLRSEKFQGLLALSPPREWIQVRGTPLTLVLRTNQAKIENILRTLFLSLKIQHCRGLMKLWQNDQVISSSWPSIVFFVMSDQLSYPATTFRASSSCLGVGTPNIFYCCSILVWSYC